VRDGQDGPSLLAEAFMRVRSDARASTALDGLLNEQNVGQGLKTLPPLQHWGATPAADDASGADRVVQALLALLPAGYQPTHGSGFPDLPGYGVVKAKYLDWLTRAERRLTRSS
jgi:hypothetical protein